MGYFMNNKHHIRIAVDIDEVLSDTYPLIIKIGTSLGLRVQDLSQYHPRHWFGVEGDHLAILQNIIDAHLAEASPVEGSVAAISALNGEYQLIAVTGRSEDRHGTATRSFIDSHFSGLFEDIVFADMEGANRSKGEIANILGVSVLVDDLPTYVEDAALNGVPAVHLSRGQTWQRVVDHPLVFPASSWAEVPTRIKSCLSLLRAKP